MASAINFLKKKPYVLTLPAAPVETLSLMATKDVVGDQQRSNEPPATQQDTSMKSAEIERESAEAGAVEAERLKKKKALLSTIKTGPLGVTTPAPVYRTTLG